MSETLGSLIDKLTTVDLKMWNNQEILYEIRRMSFDEFKEKYFDTEIGAELLWESLQKACDLNVQRNNLIDEIDDFVVTMFNDAKHMSSADFEELYLQRKHKTY